MVAKKKEGIEFSRFLACHRNPVICVPRKSLASTSAIKSQNKQEFEIKQIHWLAEHARARTLVFSQVPPSDHPQALIEFLLDRVRD
jgi:hypothetical protein